jgi:hypothetical protein
MHDYVVFVRRFELEIVVGLNKRVFDGINDCDGWSEVCEN